MKITASLSPTDLLEKTASHFTYLEEFFHQTSSKFEFRVVIMNVNLPSNKVWSFRPFLRTLLSKADTMLIGKYNYNIKNSFLEPILA
jgi:hypothetical protein